MSALTERLGRQAVAIYIAAESTVADDIADGLRQAVAEIARLTAEVERLREALSDMIELAQEGSHFKGGYLCKKHGDAERIAQARVALADTAPDGREER